MTAVEIIKYLEGFSDRLYKCTSGKWTIGYGYNIEDRGLPKDICEELLLRDVTRIRQWLHDNFTWFSRLNEARKIALISMVYQLGEKGFLGFRNMLKALNEMDYDRAHLEMLDSKWAKQTPERARKTAIVIRTGDERFFY